MKNPTMALLIMISFLLIVGRSSGRSLMKNNLFIAPDSPSDFDPIPNALDNDGSSLHKAVCHVEDAVQCHEQTSPSLVKCATSENTLSFSHSTGFQKIKVPHSPVDSAGKAEGVSNLVPKGKVTLSQPRPTVNSLVTQQRLSTSSNSSAVVDMGMIRPTSRTVNVHIFESNRSHGDDRVLPRKSRVRESNRSHGDDRVLPKKSKMRKLVSSPSPGKGHSVEAH